jgi:hypothetical protein
MRPACEHRREVGAFSADRSAMSPRRFPPAATRANANANANELT